MRVDSTTTLSVVLTSIMTCISANGAATVQHCCSSYPSEQIQQQTTDDRRIGNVRYTDNGGGGDSSNHNSSRSSNIPNSSIDISELIACKAQCDAQWKSDFYLQFQKSYDEDFYEFPLDATITESLHNFRTFCNVTKQKIACWSKQCRINTNYIAWSSDLHICVVKRLQFENALNCLKCRNTVIINNAKIRQFAYSTTSAGAHNECNEICRKLARRYRTLDTEKQYLYELSVNLPEFYQYRQLNKQCAFQICQLECRQELMRNMCEQNETVSALDVLQDYYKEDLLDQMRSLTEVSREHLYPLMCRQYLPVQYHLKLSNETSNKIKQAILSIKYAVHGIAEMLTET